MPPRSSSQFLQPARNLFAHSRTAGHTNVSSLVQATIGFRYSSTAHRLPDSCRNGPLTGIKILDLSRVLAAPFCTQILGDYGADVIKIEDVSAGDDTRYWRTAGEEKRWKKDAGPMSNYFSAVNRNKRSLSLDLKQNQGKQALLELAKDADVLVENMRPGVTTRLGIDYETIRDINPRIIYASVSGYGPSGPYASRAGYDMIAGAEAGMLHLTGERNGPPVRPGLGITDMSTGLFMHGAIIAALYARNTTGRGQKLDASLFESQVALLTNVATTWLNMGQEAQRWGTQHPSVVPYDAFKSKDLYFVCGATNDKQFKILCSILNLPGLPDDMRFSTNATRVEHRDELFPLLNEAFSKKTTEEWNAAFEGSGMPYAPINTIEKVCSHPQTHARDMLHEIELPAAINGKVKLLGTAVKFSETKATIRARPPLLGEHSKEILRELGYSEERLGEMTSAKIIRASSN